MSKIELKHIDKFYGKNHILKDVNLTIEDGDFMTLLGPSGCGKSTLLSLLAGLLTPEEGSVYIGDAPLKEAQAGIGYMLQRDHLFEWRTIRENAALGLEIRHRKTKAAMKTLDEMLENYGLAEFADAHPSELSGGMRQRAALIRTLILKPDLLLLDEPFSALDYQTRLTVCDDIATIIRETKKAGNLISAFLFIANFSSPLFYKFNYFVVSLAHINSNAYDY